MVRLQLWKSGVGCMEYPFIAITPRSTLTQNFRIWASLSDSLVLYPGHSLEILTLLHRCSQCILQPSRLGSTSWDQWMEIKKILWCIYINIKYFNMVVVHRIRWWRLDSTTLEHGGGSAAPAQSLEQWGHWKSVVITADAALRCLSLAAVSFWH